jgi:trimeric autotransporter adhesin
MRFKLRIPLVALAVTTLFAGVAVAQTPRLVRYTGLIHDSTGAPVTGPTTLTFAIYAEPEGGTSLWSETQVVTLDESGRYRVMLGAMAAEGLPVELFAQGSARWLAIAVNGGPEAARVALVSVPYALKAADADTVGGKPVSAFVLASDPTPAMTEGRTALTMTSSPTGTALTSGTAGYLGMFTNSTDLGDSAIFQTGTNIGVGTTTPAAPFHSVAAAAPGAFFDVYSNSLGALPVVFRAARGTKAAPTAVQTDDILGGLAVRGYGATGFSEGKGQVMFRAAEPWTDTATGTYLQLTTTPIGSTNWLERIRIAPNGNVGIGTTLPTQKLTVVGTVESTAGGFKFPDGTTQTTGALTSVAAGSGILVSGGSTPTISANFAGTGGDFGTLTNVARGNHLHDGRYLSLAGGALLSNGVAVNSGVLAYGVSALSSGVGSHAIEGISGAGVGVYGATSTGYAGLFDGRLGVANTSGNAVEIIQASGAGNGVQVLTSSVNAGVYAETFNTNFATAVAGRGNAANAAGVGGSSTAGRAVMGLTSSGVGVYGAADPAGWAAYFSGDAAVLNNLYVSGNVFKGGGAFKIDHPLDPEHKYLSHSFVESPDMKNIYDGVAVFDESGDAVITLPEWFQALNRDYRYQLTPIGAHMPLYVADELKNNSFRIAGGLRGKKVSWQITGIRQDAYANTHRIVVEEPKPDAERGQYLHPEAFNEPASKRVKMGRGTIPDPSKLPGTPKRN